MATLKLELDLPTYLKLVKRAVQERRPIVWQAEVELTRALAAVEVAEGEVAALHEQATGGRGQ